MKSLFAVALLLASFALSSGNASTPALSLERASSKARSEALVLAGQAQARTGRRTRVSVRYCVRKQRHIVDCRIRLRDARARCYITLRVRLVDGRLQVAPQLATQRCAE